MPNKQNVKWTIGKQSDATTAVSTTAVLPVRGIGSLDRTIEKKEDPAIVGAGMAIGEYPVAADVKGSLPLSPRSCSGFGQVLKGVFGTESSTEVIGIVRLRYTGSSASAKITTDVGAKTINAKIGALGSESNDAAFGTSGTLTLTATANDTITELVAVIEAYTDWEARIVTGSGASTITSVVTGTFQAKGKWVYLLLTGTTGAYAHRFTPDLAIGSERANFSVQKDGFQDNYKYPGIAFDSLSLSASMKAELEADVELLGLGESSGQVASVLTLNDSKPFLFAGGVASIGGVDYTYCRKVSAKITNSHKTDGYGQASIDRAYHAKGKFSIEGELSLRLDATSILERPKVEAGTVASISLHFYAAESKKVGTTSIAEMLILEIPFAELSEFTFDENGEIIDCTCKWKGFYPGGTTYDSPVVATMTSSDSSVY